MSAKGNVSSIPVSSRTIGTSVREEDVESVRERFIDTFPPPSIVLKPQPEAVSSAPPAAYRVLVACDLSEFAEGVLREAVHFAHGQMPAELHLVAVVQQAKEHYILQSDEKRQHMSRDFVVSLMSNLIWKVGIHKGSPLEDAMQHIALHVCVGEPAKAILDLSRDIRADLIVVGSRDHSGLMRRVWGSVSRTIMTHADCSVVLSRPVDFVHGHRTPSIEPPKMWESKPHHLPMHHYYSRPTGCTNPPHML